MIKWYTQPSPIKWTKNLYEHVRLSVIDQIWFIEKLEAVKLFLNVLDHPNKID